MAISLIFTACSANTGSTARQSDTASGRDTTGDMSQINENAIEASAADGRNKAGEALTLGALADYLMTAADDYNDKLDRSNLLADMEGGESTVATRLQALVMVSRAFGQLPAPAGNNARITTTDVDLSSVPNWAVDALENLKNGGMLAESDFTDIPMGAGTGKDDSDLMMADPAAPMPDGAEDAAADGIPDSDSAVVSGGSGETNAEEGSLEDADGYGLAMPEDENAPVEGEIAGSKSAENGKAADSEAAAEGSGTVNALDSTVSLEDVQRYCKRIFALLGTNLKDDFYNTVNKDALDQSTVDTSGISSVGDLSTLSADNQQKLENILEELAAGVYENGTKEQKLADLYKQVLDMDKRNALGSAPIQKYLNAIDAAENMEVLDAALDTMAQDLGTGSYFGYYPMTDEQDNTKRQMHMMPPLQKVFFISVRRSGR